MTFQILPDVDPKIIPETQDYLLICRLADIIPDNHRNWKVTKIGLVSLSVKIN